MVTDAEALSAALMWGLDATAIRAALAKADGQEIASGKVFSAQSSSALAINAFGAFLHRPQGLPPLPGTEDLGWPALSVRIEAKVPFPWTGGRTPNLDVLIETKTALIGVESKRYEPFDSHGQPSWSETYWKHDWGVEMARYAAMRDASRDGHAGFRHLEEAQLVKHAFGLLAATSPGRPCAGKTPVLLLLRAEPRTNRGGKPLAESIHADVAAEVERFRCAVEGDRVRFGALTYRALLASWLAADDRHLRAHAAALTAFFDGDM